MKLFWNYLKSKRNTLGIFVLFFLLFSTSFLLYGLPTAAILYPALLCLFFGVLFLLIGFLQFRKKHDDLERLCRLAAEMIDSLPPATTPVEADYQALFRTAQTQMTEQGIKADVRFRDMTDYYTLWAHQIKTPISAMKLTLQSEDSAAARRLSADLFRIEQYVEMALTYLRLDNTSDYVFKEYCLDDIIRPAARKFSFEFIQRKLRFEYEPITQTVITDRKWCSFVLEQLLSNALKYTRTGSISITVTEPNILCITDTGIGINSADLPRVFEKGYTGLNGRTDRQSSGIGLYLCKQICNRLGIGITIESAIDRGTTVRLDFSQHRVLCD